MNINLIVKILIMMIIFIIVTMLIRQNIADKKARRIAYYSLEPLKDDTISLSEYITKFYFNLLGKNRKILKKISYFNKKAKKYEKFIKYKHRDMFVAIDFISNKIMIMLLFLLLTIISGVFTTGISIFSLFISAVLGYYLLDIFLFFYYKRQTKLIENELLRSIIIMNNAFKSGKSTLQALKIAADDLPEPISDEFKKMYFDRFAKRFNLEEAVYLSSSLTILNKTGGNIVEVFSSIERTLFDKKKLNEELKNISASPKMVTRVLFIIPIVFTLIIYILNPVYFAPLFESTLGYMIIGIILLMFIIYILVLNRIMKIDV